MNIFTGNARAVRSAAAILHRYKDLTWEMAKRELTDRYVGQTLGIIWAIFHPLFLIALYVLIFAYILNRNPNNDGAAPVDYTLYILSGLVAWLSFQELLVKSCTTITANASLVKQVVFPLEILPVKSALVSLFPQLVSLLVLLLYVFLYKQSFSTIIILLPVLLILQFFQMLGVAYILGAVGVYLKDIKDFVTLFASVGIYLTPLFYSTNTVPSFFKTLVFLNPFSHLIWCYQDLLYFGKFEHPWSWVFLVLISPAIFIFGFRFFKKLKPSFGNIL